MGLVEYSDSEGSDAEAQPPPFPTSRADALSTKAAVNPIPAATFQKTELRKIKVDLPVVKPDGHDDGKDDGGQPLAKRARTGGAFGGFNSLLPAPKRPAAQPNAIGKGVGLKTSSEAAFNRNAASVPDETDIPREDDEFDREKAFENSAFDEMPDRKESDQDHDKTMKIVGKSTRFKPLSVSTQKKKKKKTVNMDDMRLVAGDKEGPNATGHVEPWTSGEHKVTGQTPTQKAGRTLFSTHPQDEEEARTALATRNYESLTTQVEEPVDTDQYGQQYEPQQTSMAMPGGSLAAVAADLNLTPAQKRHLFGRNAKDATSKVQITHFNTDSEYASNEILRQSGEQVEQRAVKTITPGKHSLQQLVNNARSNQDRIEDKWAEGKANRGEAGGKYGWGGGK